MNRFSLNLFFQGYKHALFDLLIVTPLDLLNQFLVTISRSFLDLITPLCFPLFNLHSHFAHVKSLHLIRTQDLNSIHLVILSLTDGLLALELY
jgi:hypothetical protein